MTRYRAIFSLPQTFHKFRQRIGQCHELSQRVLDLKRDTSDTEQYFHYLKHPTNSDNASATCHELSLRVLDLNRDTYDTEQYFHYLKHPTNSDNALATCHELSQRVLDRKRVNYETEETSHELGHLQDLKCITNNLMNIFTT